MARGSNTAVVDLADLAWKCRKWMGEALILDFFGVEARWWYIGVLVAEHLVDATLLSFRELFAVLRLLLVFVKCRLAAAALTFRHLGCDHSTPCVGIWT